MAENGSYDEDLMFKVQLVRQSLRQTKDVFDWKYFIFPQVMLVGAMVFSTLSLYKFSLVSFSIFSGTCSILAFFVWLFQCLRNKQAADRVQDMGLEICALTTSCASDAELRREGHELFREIELHETVTSEQTGKVGRNILIYLSLFMAWLIFTVGDISPHLSRTESTMAGNIFVFLAVLLVIVDLRR